MTTYTTRTDHKDRTVIGHVDFGVTDRLGRKMGIRAYSTETTYTVAPEGTNYGYTVAPGHYYTYVTQPTRDGERHQKSTYSELFATAEERDLALNKAIEGARKRALKPQARLKA